MVFQNPFDTLNPSHSVGSQIVRVLEKFGVEHDAAEGRRSACIELLDMVKLPRDFAKRRPRQLSGGQKQRVGIARAFAGDPKMVVADEPVSALDVSVQAAVTELLMDIQREHRTTMLFISHDLSVVRYLADRVVVMYLGQIMEQGTTDEIFSPPYHPYTEALLSAMPIADTSVQEAQDRARGRNPLAVEPAARLPVPDPLPLHDEGHLRHGCAPAARVGAAPRHRLPPRRGDAARHAAGDHNRAARGGGRARGASLIHIGSDASVAPDLHAMACQHANRFPSISPRASAARPRPWVFTGSASIRPKIR